MSYLNPDRIFDPNPTIRNIARELYAAVKELPIVCPHGHVDPGYFSRNDLFPDPTELILIPDHYVFRLLYSQGITMEDIGIPTIDGSAVETDHRKIWQVFADHYHLFAGTPTGVWLDVEFAEVFGIEERLTGESAMRLYDAIAQKLQSGEFSPRNMFDRFNIEVLNTTDGISDTLEEHQQIMDSDWDGRVLPCFRPDAVVDLMHTDWAANIAQLAEVVGKDIASYKGYIAAFEERRAYFKTMGAVSTDQGIENPYTHRLTDGEAETIFQRALAGKATEADAAQFTAHMLMEMARMSVDDGLVMQIHPGSYRNHNQSVFERYGRDKGADIPVQTEYTRNLHELLNTYGNNPDLKIIIFTLDETNYAREMAPLAGHYPALKLGPAWWFQDSIEGMTRYRQQTTETASIYNTVGFNDDTRAFPSIPARHDVARRVDANFLAGKVARHIIDIDTAHVMIKDLTYNLVKKAYNL